METSNNIVVLVGRVAKVYPLKLTVSRLPVVTFVVEHQSKQLEAGMPLDVRCRVYCVALNNIDLVNNINLGFLDSTVEVCGFLSFNSRSQLVLHVRQIKFLDKGN